LHKSTGIEILVGEEQKRPVCAESVYLKRAMWSRDGKKNYKLLGYLFHEHTSKPHVLKGVGRR